ncbi:hypothetical protein CEXT_335681 [Caerostris extrusa]|uniref:Uncharacterized protein n=1 Tax=Caerostris extrusa TaxID=172846 RepID=A0AAV4RFK2_CAEEX|nr:hypothetical protein CEXT_335681 [Caerostris extrusa]
MIMKPANIHAFMKQLNADLNIKITCKLTTQYLKLEPDTESLHATITKFLDDTNVPYYIITPKNLRPVKAVLRGLPINKDIDAIKTKLTDLNFQILNIYQLKNSTKPGHLCHYFKSSLLLLLTLKKSGL